MLTLWRICEEKELQSGPEGTMYKQCSALFIRNTVSHTYISVMGKISVLCHFVIQFDYAGSHISKDCCSTFKSFLLCLCISQYHMYFLQWMSVFSPPRRQKLTWRLKWL